MDKSLLNEVFIKKNGPVTPAQANRTQDRKAARLPDDKNAHIAKIDNQINKLIHHAKIKGNSPKIQRMIRRAKLSRNKIAKKLNN
jgi:hypothetical protein